MDASAKDPMSRTKGHPNEAARAPEVAVIIPIFRHSVVLVEAIEAALTQEDGRIEVNVVLVNDGCPHPETDQVCRDYALTYPERVHYVQKPNGGLSDARNVGIKHALAAWPSLKAIYMLDSDNRLRPGALARAYAALQANPDAGWIYPNIDMFGLDRACDYGGPYSLLVHTKINVSEAGSLINRAVFDAGVFFDTDFKMGFEDWDFFLTAAEAGFRGVNLEDFGLLYRKRPESMLADASRDGAYIRGQLELKHKALYSPKNRIELEHTELPRYAIHFIDEGIVRFASDPAAIPAREIPFREYEAGVLRALSSKHHFTPTFLVATTRHTLDALTKQGLVHSTFWMMETRIKNHDIVAVQISEGAEGRVGMSVVEADQDLRCHAHLSMINFNALAARLKATSDAALQSLTQPDCTMNLSGLRLLVPQVDPMTEVLDDALQGLRDSLLSLRRSQYLAASQMEWDWRLPDMRLRPPDIELLRQDFGGAPVFPRISDGRKHIGLVLPLVEFGGVEKVALNMARALKRAGWTPHVFVLDASNAAISQEWKEAVETVTFLMDDGFNAWAGGKQDYLGTPIPKWANEGDHGRALAMLYWLDAVINFHGGAFCGAVGALRRLGLKTATSLHLSDLTPFGRPWGNTYLSLAYEHAFDLFVPCSNMLGEWCHGMGVPAAKVVPVPNAPAFSVPRQRLVDGMAKREARADDSPLRVLFLGRLDPQKGLERLSALVTQSDADGLNLDWRFIGKAVLGGQSVPERILNSIEPPVGTEGLIEAYDWADVVVLMSEYEGLPLTILEAMRQGAVMLATDVGANSEVVVSGENGVLVDLETAVPDALAALKELSTDRSKLRAMSRRAFADLAARTWDNAMTDFIKRLG